MLLKKHQTIELCTKEIFNFIPVENILKIINKKDVLVIFDVDDVLITPSEENDFRHPYRTMLWNDITNELPLNKIVVLESIILSSSQRILVESRIANMFDYLKSQQIPTIALTATGTGNFGIIQQKEDFRIKELQNVNIFFEHVTPLHGKCRLPELENTNFIFSECKGIPMLKSGIIFTAGVDKGLILEQIFSQYSYYPKTIVFIDDNFQNINSLENLCIKLKINFYGFHYKAASLIPLPVIDETLEKLRFEILKNKNVWLNYKELNTQPLKY